MVDEVEVEAGGMDSGQWSVPVQEGKNGYTGQMCEKLEEKTGVGWEGVLMLELMVEGKEGEWLGKVVGHWEDMVVGSSFLLIY